MWYLPFISAKCFDHRKADRNFLPARTHTEEKDLKAKAPARPLDDVHILTFFAQASVRVLDNLMR